jgi:prephenate dehydrogenase
MFKKIAIFGLGLLGGSLCKSARRVFPDVEITACGRNIQRLESARSLGIVDLITGIEDADLRGIGLVVVSMPVVKSVRIIKDILANPDFAKNALIIDVGSVKEKIVSVIEGEKRAGSFIGCHPMAGSEKSGYEHATDSLYDNSTVVITPNVHNRPDDIAIICEFWRKLGARTVEIPAGLHDEIITFTSHLPHMAACSVVDLLMNKIGHDHNIELEHFIGRGFRDVTRISAGSPEMWMDICRMNHSRISESIDLLIDRLKDLKRIISETDGDQKELMLYFESIKNYREKL